jgi:peptidoglycan/xylan/chitin deacetylase (PgdA/CDA1 family)
VKLAIKIDVDGLTPALKGAPCLADLLDTQAAGATFLFSVGPDRSGRHVGRLFRRGMPSRLWRTRSIRSYGIGVLLFGTLLPAPDIGRRAADIMRAIRDGGFETGVRGFDSLEWCESATRQDPDWIGRQMKRAWERYQKILGEPPHVHGAPGWQLNRVACRFTQRLDFAYSSDTRGTHPFIPVYQAEVISCPQLPTTLPTMDELITHHAMPTDKVVAHLLDMTREPAPWGHVYSANAAFEGLKLLPQFEQLLRGWRHQGYEIVSLRDYMLSFDTRELPYHEVITATVPGRPGTVATQGKEFLS